MPRVRADFKIKLGILNQTPPIKVYLSYNYVWYVSHFLSIIKVLQTLNSLVFKAYLMFVLSDKLFHIC